MKVRLGFSVAAHLNPDVLLIDEVLSVGDASFRKRCIDRLTNYSRKGGTIIFVSHNAAVVETMCDRFMSLDHGRMVEIGKPSELIRKYEAQSLKASRSADLRSYARQGAAARDNIQLTFVGCYDLAGHPKAEYDFGQPFEIRLRYKMKEDVRLPYFVITLEKGERLNRPVTAMSMMWDGVRLEDLPAEGEIGCIVKGFEALARRVLCHRGSYVQALGRTRGEVVLAAGRAGLGGHQPRHAGEFPYWASGLASRLSASTGYNGSRVESERTRANGCRHLRVRRDAGALRFFKAYWSFPA